MGGQDGYAIDRLSYGSTTNTLMAGVHFSPTERWDLGLDLTWSSSDGKIDPFDLPADDYVATHPSTMFDFSQTPEYSELDVSRWDVSLLANFHINKGFYIGGRYRYAKFDDKQPYLYDTTGSINVLTGYLGWTF